MLLAVLLTSVGIARAEPPKEATYRTLWQYSIAAAMSEGRVQASFVPIYAQGDDVVVAVTEALDPSARPKVRAFIERLGPQGLRWRYELSGLLPGTLLETALSPLDADGRALLAVTFQTDKAPVGGEYGRLLSIDLGSGAVDRVVSLKYPRLAGQAAVDGEDRLHVFGALRLGKGKMLSYGGIGVGPYRWFAELHDADGKLMWDAGAPPRGYGEAHGAREVAGGIELLVHAIAYTPDYGDRYLLVRLDGQGKIASTTVLGRLSANQLVLLGADSLLVVERDGKVWTRDRNRHDVELARLPAGVEFMDEVGQRGQPGSWLVFADLGGQHWFIAADSTKVETADGIAGPPVEGRYALGTNGRPAKYVLQQKCTDEPAQGECHRLELTLIRAEF